MNLRSFLLLAVTLVFAACNSQPKPRASTIETPKALDDKENSFDYSLKRGHYDLVEKLYQELVNKNVDLKTLEEKIDTLYESKDDSLKTFNHFSQKNEAYFRAAEQHAHQIKDTVLKAQMNELIAQNLAKYKQTIAKHQDLLNIIEAKHLNISDLHHLLKIVKTLPLIKKYQRDHLPPAKSLEGYIKQQNKVIPVLDTLAK